MTRRRRKEFMLRSCPAGHPVAMPIPSPSPPPSGSGPSLAPDQAGTASPERLRLEIHRLEERIRDGVAMLEHYECYVACLQELARRGEALP